MQAKLKQIKDRIAELQEAPEQIQSLIDQVDSDTVNLKEDYKKHLENNNFKKMESVLKEIQSLRDHKRSLEQAKLDKEQDVKSILSAEIEPLIILAQQDFAQKKAEIEKLYAAIEEHQTAMKNIRKEIDGIRKDYLYNIETPCQSLLNHYEGGENIPSSLNLIRWNGARTQPRINF